MSTPKLILAVAAGAIGAQSLWLGFYKMLVIVCELDPQGDGLMFLKGTYVLGAIALLIATAAVAGAYIDQTWLPERRSERQRLREQRERYERELDAEVGIPRIPRAK